jgi:hypothetical protein
VTIQDLGSIGEFITALATLVTLVYLAFQIRQNTSQIRENSNLVRANVASMMAAQTSESIEFIFNPGAVELMAEGAKDFHSLPLADRMKFDSVNHQMMTRFESLFVHYKLGLLTEGQWAAKRTTLERRLVFRGVQQWWERSKEEYEPDFRRFVTEEILTSLPSPREHPASEGQG